MDLLKLANALIPDENIKPLAYYEERYAGLDPEERAELEACDKEDKDLWDAYVSETIKENEVMQKIITCFMTREY